MRFSRSLKRKACFSCQLPKAFSGKKIESKADEHCRERGEYFSRVRAQEINHHPNRDGGKNEWRQGIGPDTIGPLHAGMGRAQDDYAQNGEQRAEQQTELNVNHDEFKTSLKQEHINDD